MYHYAYLHGFASSSKSQKGTQLADSFEGRGLTLHLPDLNRPSFSRLTYTKALEAIDELDAAHADEGDRWRFIGSSMGGYLATRWTALNAERVDRLLLLCPGFNLVERWPKLLGREHFESWREQGSFPFFDAEDKIEPVHWGFIEDARRHPPFPEADVPVRIIHGRNDAVVPITSSREYAESRDHVELIEVDDDHSLTDSIDRIDEEARTFLGAKGE